MLGPIIFYLVQAVRYGFLAHQRRARRDRRGHHRGAHGRLERLAVSQRAQAQAPDGTTFSAGQATDDQCASGTQGPTPLMRCTE
jgi:hypothetical protein